MIVVAEEVCWLPGSKSELAIVTNQFVKIYDLAVDSDLMRLEDLTSPPPKVKLRSLTVAYVKFP